MHWDSCSSESSDKSFAISFVRHWCNSRPSVWLTLDIVRVVINRFSRSPTNLSFSAALEFQKVVSKKLAILTLWISLKPSFSSISRLLKDKIAILFEKNSELASLVSWNGTSPRTTEPFLRLMLTMAGSSPVSSYTGRSSKVSLLRYLIICTIVLCQYYPCYVIWSVRVFYLPRSSPEGKGRTRGPTSTCKEGLCRERRVLWNPWSAVFLYEHWV